MGKTLYEPRIPEGTHLGASHGTDGAVRGGYLDDATNKVVGNPEWVPVVVEDDSDSPAEPEYAMAFAVEEENSESSDALKVLVLIGVGILLGIAATKAYPYVKRWWNGKAVPGVKKIWHRITGKEEAQLVDVESSFPQVTATCIESFKNSFRIYLNALQQGTLSLDVIDDLLLRLEEVKISLGDSEISFAFTPEQLSVFLSYTKKIAEANCFELKELDEPDVPSGDNKVVNLHRYLEIQKQILEKAS